MNNAEQLVYEMLTENTGSHFLDSGGAYGRNHERNAKKSIDDFRREEEVRYDWNIYCEDSDKEFVELERTVSVFHYLSQLTTDDICDKFNQLNTNPDNWDADADVYGASKEAWAYLTELAKPSEVEIVDTFNTYNGESDLSQILQGSWIRIDNVPFLILQIHGGCDARGGYTNARMFEPHEEYYIHEYIQDFVYEIENEIEYIDEVWSNGEKIPFTEAMKTRLMERV